MNEETASETTNYLAKARGLLTFKNLTQEFTLINPCIFRMIFLEQKGDWTKQCIKLSDTSSAKIKIEHTCNHSLFNSVILQQMVMEFLCLIYFQGIL